MSEENRMPPPSCRSKITIPSARDKESSCDCEIPKTELFKNLLKEKSQPNLKRETVKFVKTLLGPSLEDVVFRTLEFGKTIIQKSDGTRLQTKEEQLFDVLRKEITGSSHSNLDLNFLFEEGKKIMKEHKNSPKRRSEGKSVGYKNKMDKNFSLYEKPFVKKLGNVSKIRSLDSDLKQDAPSPEKIKRQLEALIQINKDELPKHGGNWNLGLKAPKFPVEMTIMPSLCMYKNETDINGSCDTHSITSQQDCECDPDSSKTQENSKKRSPSKICQAPEFISNALGPTLDVSIIDNLKMMRDIFKCESGKGEGSQKQCSPPMKHEVRLQNSEMEMNCRIEALQKRIEELEHKEHCLVKQIEDEEHMRECKRKAFEQEKNKLCAVKSCFDKMSLNGRKENSERSAMECGLESLKMKIACEEEKLFKLKNQSDCFKRELAEAKFRKESLKRNKSLLDAWDVFASRVCHTRLPSFSRALCLERKQFRAGDTGNLHCCFPVLQNEQTELAKKDFNKCCNKSPIRFDQSDTQCSTKTRCQSQSWTQNHNAGESRCEVSQSCSKEKGLDCQSNFKWKIKMGEIQFPVQRDVFCGLHQVLKSCTCKASMKHEGHLCSSEDDLIRKFKTMKSKCEQENCLKNLNIESDKNICRSKSDTSLKRNKCPRIVKVMWATTRINVFQDNSRTYEVMDATSRPPSCMPVRTEGIFVVKTSQKNDCSSSSKKNSCVSEL